MTDPITKRDALDEQLSHHLGRSLRRIQLGSKLPQPTDAEPTEPAASDTLNDRSESVVRAAPTRPQEIDAPGGLLTEPTTSAPQLHDHRPREPSRARGSPQGKVVGIQARRDQSATGSWQ